MSAPLSTHRRLWRLAGALAIAHVVLMLVGVAFEESPELGASPQDRAAAFAGSSLATVFAGGWVEYLGFLLFLVAAMLFTRLLRGSGDMAAWLSSCIGAAGVTYTAITIATGFAAGAAALYDGHHGAPLATVTVVNDVRIFAFYLSVAVLGVFTLAMAGAVHATGALPRWVAWTGYVVGTLCVFSLPLQKWDVVNYVTMLWMIWFVALAVVALRGSRSRLAATAERRPAHA